MKIIETNILKKIEDINKKLILQFVKEEVYSSLKFDTVLDFFPVDYLFEDRIKRSLLRINNWEK